MSAFSALTLLGLGLPGSVFRRKKQDEEGAAGSTRLAKLREGEYVGKAVPRGTAITAGTPEAPPSTAQTASAAVASAGLASERARKRAAAGGTILTGRQRGLGGPRGNYAQKTLLGF